MTKEIIEKLRKATNTYQQKEEYKTAKNMLNYVKESMQESKAAIKANIIIEHEQVTFEELEQVVTEECEATIPYKSYKKLVVNQENFMQASMLVPYGVIAVNTFDTVKTFEYMLKALSSRNAICIFDKKYNEKSTKFYLLNIIKKALNKYMVDENLVMILPYSDEVTTEDFDKIIELHNEDEILLEKAISKTKEKLDSKYIYIESKELEEKAKTDNSEALNVDAQILGGSFEQVLEEINKKNSSVACIYTQNSDYAYKFINLAQTQNALVNTSLQNAKDAVLSPYELYEYKNVVMPMQKEGFKEFSKKEEEQQTKQPKEALAENIENNSKENVEENNALMIIPENLNLWQKVKNWFKKIFSSKNKNAK